MPKKSFYVRALNFSTLHSYVRMRPNFKPSFGISGKDAEKVGKLEGLHGTGTLCGVYFKTICRGGQVRNLFRNAHFRNLRNKEIAADVRFNPQAADCRIAHAH